MPCNKQNHYLNSREDGKQFLCRQYIANAFLQEKVECLFHLLPKHSYPSLA